MKVDRKWLWLGGALAGGAAALALGVSLGTLLIVAALLACPVLMSRGMRGTHQGGGGMACHPGSQEVTRSPELPTVPTTKPPNAGELAPRT